MEETHDNSSQTEESIQIRTGFLKSPWLNTSSFVLAFLLFFLPFVSIKCNDTPIATATGAQLAFGVPMETAGTLNKIKKSSEKKFTYKLEKDNKTSPNPYALVAMGLLLIGAVESVLHFRHLPWLKSVIATLAVICLIILQFDIDRKIHSDYDPATGKHNFLDAEDLVNIQAVFSPAYYIVILICLLLAALGVWQWRKRI